ncbi:zinc-dependent dehydrogenase [Desulfosporosinus hippei]|uniref:L-iditol 2-dehydrogenase n=1 Tax=Desulfosporosinus hippei DSM 8344 TaxID=1121419 RepID=A0A1G8E0Z4_9FIRM|nr:zinc-dependent dehydrogenase [Desulfosporosinus hippei]SDH63642.1 L-iditol 2-dehydrogenase [Desulfosporosinus hippei DSM 8344]
MRAAVLEAIEKLTLTNLETPHCGPGEVLIRTKACGICRTDMKCLMQGQKDLKTPRILGHEVAGTVVARGQNVNQVSVGDRVQVSPGIPCGICNYCLKGQDNLCDSVQIIGFHVHGGFAEYLLIPARGVKNGIIQTISDHISYAEAALIEPLACSVNIQNSLNVSAEDSILIIGAGPLGILNSKLARARGVKKIIVAEINERRLKNGEKFDFDYLINVDYKDLVKEIIQLTNGTGVDVAIPCCPGIEAFSQGINALAKRGRLGFFSGIIGNTALGFDFNIIHYKELLVSGAYGCSLSDNRNALGLIAKNKGNVKNMITQRLSLDEIQRGLEMVGTMSETSIIVEF